MSNTFPSIASHRFANPGQPVVMPLGITTNDSAVWNFEFGYWDLFEFWFLMLVIFIGQLYFEISYNYLF